MRQVFIDHQFAALAIALVIWCLGVGLVGSSIDTLLYRNRRGWR